MSAPGALDQRIVIQTQTTVADTYGGTSLTWSTVATVWAAVKPLSGRERYDNSAVEAPAMYRFTLRRRGDVPEKGRIVWNGQNFNVRFVADPGARQLYMSVDAERGVEV